MSDKLDAQISMTADATGVEAGVGRAKRSLKSLGEAARQAGADMGGMGAGSDLSAKQVDRNTKNMEQQLQRYMATLQAGGKDSRKYWEQMADFRGVDKNALRPLLDQLDQFKGKSSAAAEALKEVNQGVLSASEAFGMLRGAIAAVASIEAAKQMASMADTMTNMESRLKLVTSGTEALAAAQAGLFSIAQSSRVRFADLADTYSQMARSTKELGVSQKDMLAVTQTISQAVTISGGSAASASAALVQLSQGFASGTLRGEELNSVMEQTPRLAQAIAQGLGVSIGQLRNMGSEGELTAQKVVDALQKAAPAVAAEFSQMGVTIEQSMTTVGNSLLNMVGTLDKLTGASSATAHGVMGFSSNLDVLNAQIKSMAATNSLSDFFLAAFNTEKSLNEELATGRKELDELKAKLELAPSNIYLRSATADAQQLVNKLVEAQNRLNAINGGQLNTRTGGIDVGAFPTRGSQSNYEKEFNSAQQALLGVTARENGFSKQFTDDLKVYEQALKTGAMSATEYATAITDLNKKRYESSEAGKAEAKALKAGAGEAKAAENSYQGLLKAVNEHMAAVKLQMDGSAKLTESQKLQIKYDELLARGKQSASAATIALVQAQIAALAILEKEQKAIKLNVAGYQEYLALQDELADDYVKQAKAKENLRLASDRADLELQDQIARIELEAQMLGRTAEARQIAVAQLDAEIERRKELEALAKNLDLDESVREEERIRINERYAKKVALAQRKAYVSEWDRTSQLIGDTLADYIMAGGKDASTYLKRLFSTLVLQPIVQYGVNSVLGSLGLSGSAGSNSSAGSMNNALNMASLLNNAKSFYSVATQWMSGTMSGANAAGTLYANAAGTGIDGLLASNGAYGTGSGTGGLGGMSSAWPLAVVAGMIASNKLFAQGYSADNFSKEQKTWDFSTYALTKVTSKIFGEKWANILSGAPLGNFIWNKLAGGGTPHMGAGAVYDDGTVIGDKSTVNVNQAKNWSSGTQDLVSGVAQQLGGMLDGLSTILGGSAGWRVETGFSGDGDDKSRGLLSISDADGTSIAGWGGKSGRYSKNLETAWGQYLAEVSTSALAAMKVAAPDWGDTIIDSATAQINSLAGNERWDAMTQLVQQIAAVKAQLLTLGDAMDMFKDMSGAVESKLISASGGIDALVSNAGQFYEQYYSEAEKQAKAVAQLQDVFAKYDSTLPDTREGFRALVETQMAAGESGAEFAAVLLGLSSQFAAISDVWAKELSEMSSSAADFFSDLHESIAAAQVDVAASRKDILRGTGAMSAEEIAAAIAGINTVGPSQAGIGAADLAASAAAAAAAQAQSVRDAYAAAAGQQQSSLTGLQTQRSDAQAQIDTAKKNADSTQAWAMDQWLNRRGSHSYRKYTVTQIRDDAQAAYEQTLQQMTGVISGLDAAIAQQQGVYDSAAAAAKVYADQLSAAQVILAATQHAQVQAQVDYAAAMKDWVVEAGTSVTKLSELRGEVVDFYEAQAAAVQGMLQSAGNLRSVVDQVRLGQLNTAQTATELGNRYAVDYAMAMATTGSTRAGYVDSMAGNLQSLSEALKAEAVTGADWRIQTAKLLAQASNAAGLLEGDAEADDYQDVALGLLDSIDTALESLGAATVSAEQIIADAIKAGTAAQLDGLRAIVAALKGDPIPAFAAGGYHAGGLRWVGENGPELEATGPSRIWNQSQLASAMGGGGGSELLVAEIRALREEQRAQSATIVRLQQDNNRLLMRWETQGLPTERDEV